MSTVAAMATAGILVALLIVDVLLPSRPAGPVRGRPGNDRTVGATRPARPAPATTVPPRPVWRVAWGSAMAWGFGTASDATVRDLATVGVGGTAIRVRISNVFGNAPLVIGAASVGFGAGGAAVEPGTLHRLLFSGKRTVTVPVGGFVYSDPAAMTVTAMRVLAISLFVRNADLVTEHPCCTKVVSYFTPNGGGDLTGSLNGRGLSTSSPWERWVDAVDVLQTTGRGSIVVIGDSITDGFNATLRWTTVLQQRIETLPAAEQRAVVNEGITANALTSAVHTDSAVGGGPSGLSRLGLDAIDQAGVSEVVLFLGTNDLWFGATREQLIAGYRDAIADVRQRGLRIIAVTLLPRSSSPQERWTAFQQAEMEQVNRWILTSGSFDGVLNLAAAVADVYNGACDADRLFPAYDSGDHLHPDDAGLVAMANAIDPAVLGLPALPRVPRRAEVTPTPGCRG
jgi:lysophospholipase L1-like esterase